MISVTNQAEFLQALLDQEAEILVINDIHLNTRININYTVTVSSEPLSSLLWDNPSASLRELIVINANGNLTIENINIDCQNGDGSPFHILGGTLNMNDGATIKNIVSTTSQNAVKIGVLGSDLIGTFNMNGGLITMVESSSTIMSYSGRIFMNNDAKIAFNKAGAINMSRSTDKPRPFLQMSDTASICDNEALLAPGAGVTIGADIVMGVKDGDAPTITRNTSLSYYVGGWNLTTNSTLTMNNNSEMSFNEGAIGGAFGISSGSAFLMGDNAVVKNNKSLSQSGGGYISSSEFMMKDNAKIIDNTCVEEGGGIRTSGTAILYLTGNSVISGNSAESGGGIYLSENAKLFMYDEAKIENNTAQSGLGVFKTGEMRVKNSPKILDGLFYDNSGVIIIETPLEENARFVLEESDYVAVENVPLVLAITALAMNPLTELDKNAFVLPSGFLEAFKTFLSDTFMNVYVDFLVFNIEYQNLEGVTHSNPTEYTLSDLPIALLPPDNRVDYVFLGWFDGDDNQITEITEDMLGDLTIFAKWEQQFVHFLPNGFNVWNLPKKLPTKNNKAIIPNVIPCRRCFKFVCWNVPSSGSGRVFFAGDTVELIDQSLTLSAQWMPC